MFPGSRVELVAADRRTGSRAGDPQGGGGVLRRRRIPSATSVAAATPVAAPHLTTAWRAIIRGTVTRLNDLHYVKAVPSSRIVALLRAEFEKVQRRAYEQDKYGQQPCAPYACASRWNKVPDRGKSCAPPVEEHPPRGLQSAEVNLARPETVRLNHPAPFSRTATFHPLSETGTTAMGLGPLPHRKLARGSAPAWP
jgi:hypothetical protein